MAKKSFKDLIFQYLKKDEDAPANATGTAVAGTGDDSSTVVVKKKKELQKKLMTRMGITETINRTIPDLEYPKDEIRERVNQLKELALGEATPDPIKYGPDKVAKAMAIATKSSGNYSGAVRDIEKIGKDLSKVSTIARALKTANEDLNKDDEKTIKPIIKQLKKSVTAHDKQAKDLEKAMTNEMAKDKAYAIGMATAKKKYNDEPPLDKKTIKKGHEIGDKLSKMKNEDHPAKQMFEQIEGLKNKAEKSGMPYGILKKVYDRGMAAWRGGHRPGTTQQQWAFARVNSFITKSSGTWGGADKDLAAKVKGK